MFHIDYAKKQDVDSVMFLIKTAMELLPNPDWFVDDTKEFYASHIEEKGFTLKAVQDGKMAAFFTIRFPGFDEDNLGLSLPLPKEDLLKVAHMETAVVHPDYRGNHLEEKLMASAISILKNTPYRYLMGTVHPDNEASVKSFLHNGFHIEQTTEKYGGLPRHIMLRIL